MQDVTISTSVPEDISAEIERMARDMMISKAAVIRQILASAVRKRKSEEAGK